MTASGSHVAPWTQAEVMQASTHLVFCIDVPSLARYFFHQGINTTQLQRRLYVSYHNFAGAEELYCCTCRAPGFWRQLASD